MRRVAVTAAIAAAFFLSVRVSGRDQAPPDKEKSFTSSAEVALVEVPVHVTGKDGLPVRDLTKDDFELFDDGKRVAIEQVDRTDLEDFSKGLPTTPDMPIPVAARRYFFLLFDMSFSRPTQLARGRDAALHFIQNGMKNGDVAGVGTFDAEKGMKLILSFTADHDQLTRAVDTLGLPNLVQATGDPLALIMESPGSVVTSSSGGPGASTGDAEFAEQMRALAALSRKSFDSYQVGRVTAAFKGFEDLARSMNSVKGRKHIIYFSEGFDSRLLTGVSSGAIAQTEGDQALSGEIWKIDSNSRFGNSELQQKLASMLAIFRRTDCTIHSVDLSGLTARSSDVQSRSSGDTVAQDQEGGRGRGQDTLFMLAHDTGGEVLKNSNDIPGQLERIQQQTAVTYILVFAPAKLTEPGRYHDLKVKVKRSGTQVSARAGYYEPRPFSKLSPMERRLATAQMLAWGLPRTDIAARVLAAPFRTSKDGKAAVPVIVEIPGDRLLYHQIGEKLPLELYAYATDSQLRVRDFFTQNVALDLGKLRGSLAAGGLKYYGTLHLPPGSFWLKVLVRNAETGRVGLQIVPITVPGTDRPEPFVLPPLFHESPGRWIMVKADSKQGTADAYPFVAAGASYIPSALPVVKAGKDAEVSLVLYDVPDNASLEFEGRIKASNGRDVGPAKLVRSGHDEAGPLGSRHVLCMFRPENLAPGPYSLVVTSRSSPAGYEAQSAIAIEVQ